MKLADMTGDELKREIARLDYENYRIEAADRLRFQVEFAHAAVKGLTLVNGGAIVALFTLIGGTAAQFDARLLWWAFGLFAAGLSATLIASASAFFTQGYYMISTLFQMWNAQAEMLGAEAARDFMEPYRKGRRAQIAGIIAAVVAIVAFIGGSGCALAGVLAG